MPSEPPDIASIVYDAIREGARWVALPVTLWLKLSDPHQEVANLPRRIFAELPDGAIVELLNGGEPVGGIGDLVQVIWSRGGYQEHTKPIDPIDGGGDGK